VRRIIVAALGTISSLVLLFAYPTSHNATVSADGAQPASGAGGGVGSASSGSASSGTASSGAAGSSKSTSGARTYTGNAAQTRWGTVQVRITVKSGKITAAEAVRYPDDNGHSQGINSYALPVLAQEAVAAQSAQIDSVSGATVTSGGYVQSLQSAVNAAHL
jgi:uncharacterized protein with FMN-binding domain